MIRLLVECSAALLETDMSQGQNSICGDYLGFYGFLIKDVPVISLGIRFYFYCNITKGTNKK